MTNLFFSFFDYRFSFSFISGIFRIYRTNRSPFDSFSPRRRRDDINSNSPIRRPRKFAYRSDV